MKNLAKKFEKTSSGRQSVENIDTELLGRQPQIDDKTSSMLKIVLGVKTDEYRRVNVWKIK